MRYYTKHECLDRARQFLAQQDDDVLTYAALELRLTIEAIIYDKLRSYEPYVPAAVLQIWQPDQALKRLLEFEPDADQDMRLAFGMDQSDGSPGPMYAVGEHRTFKVAWLRKHYHKLGSMLHAPRASEEERDPSAARAYLSDLMGEISKVADATIIAMPFATRVRFTCGRCGRKSVANATVVERIKRAVCIHAGCEATHRQEWNDGKWRLVLDTLDFSCQACETVIPIERGRIEAGMEFACSACATQHVILSSGWRYATKAEVAARGQKQETSQREADDKAT